VIKTTLFNLTTGPLLKRLAQTLLVFAILLGQTQGLSGLIELTHASEVCHHIDDCSCCKKSHGKMKCHEETRSVYKSRCMHGHSESHDSAAVNDPCFPELPMALAYHEDFSILFSKLFLYSEHQTIPPSPPPLV